MRTNGSKRRFGLKFRHERHFGEFCDALALAGVPYVIAGFKTLVLTGCRLVDLPEGMQKIISAARRKKLIQTTDDLPCADFFPKLQKLAPEDAAIALQDIISELTSDVERSDPRSISPEHVSLASLCGKEEKNPPGPRLIDLAAFKVVRQQRAEGEKTHKADKIAVG